MVVAVAIQKALETARVSALYKPSRELSLAITKLEEAEMWALKSKEVK